MRRLFASMLVLLFTVPVWAQRVGETVSVREPVEDLYAAGQTVELRAQVGDDAVVAGQWITVLAPVAQDLIAAGEMIRIQAPIGDDVRVAGRRIQVEGSVGGHMLAAGESVTIAPRTTIGRFAWLAGRELRIDGDVGGDLRLAGENVFIGGHVAGDVEVAAEQVELLPGARIEGNLSWRGGKPRIAEGAQVVGQIIERPLPASEEPGAAAALVFGLLMLTGFLIAGIALYLLFPGVAVRSAAAVRREPGKTLVLGLAVLVLMPLAIIGLFVTTIGSLLALILLALYLAALPLGLITGAYAVGEWGLHRSGRPVAGHGARILALFLALLGLALLQLLPFFGSLIGFLVTLGGLGALSLLLWQGRATPPAEA